MNTPLPWIQTYHGRAFPILEPVPEHVDMGEVAESLAKLCRFNGHCQTFYSVAQHSVLVADILESSGAANPLTTDGSRLLLYGLLHDAHEAYLGDFTTPVKQALGMACPGMGTELKRIAAGIDAAIFTAAGLDSQMPEAVANLVHEADLVALATERRDLLSDGPEWHMTLPDAMPKRLRADAWPKALDAFTTRLRSLTQWDENASGESHRL